MSRVAVPRWALLSSAIALVASIVMTVGAYRSVSGSSHEDSPLYGCMYAGSLSQLSTTPPVNCGRGTLVTWPSYADFVALQDALDSNVEDLQGLIDALTLRVSALETENDEQQEEIDDLQTDLATQVEDLQSQIDTLGTDLDALQTELDNEIERLEGLITDLQTALDAEETARIAGDSALQTALDTDVDDLQGQIDDLQSQIDDLQTQIDDNETAFDNLFDTVGSLWQTINEILSGDFSGAAELLEDLADELEQVGTVINNFFTSVFSAIEDWFCDGPLGFLCPPD